MLAISAAGGCVAIEVTPASGSWILSAPAGYTGLTHGVGNLMPQFGPTGMYAVGYGALAVGRSLAAYSPDQLSFIA